MPVCPPRVALTGLDMTLGLSGPGDSGGQGASNICWSETILSGGLPKIPLK